MPSRFNDSQVDDAIQYVIDHGAVDRANTLRYTAVFVAAGMEPPQELHLGGEGDVVTAFMKRFHDRCLERGLPPLDSLVVHVAGAREDRPGGGYFKVNGNVDPFGQRGTAEQVTAAWALWEEQKTQVRSWGINQRRHG